MLSQSSKRNRTTHLSCHSVLFVVCDIGDFSWMVRGDLVNGPLTITLGTLKLATHWDGRGREIKMLTRKRVLRERVVDWDKLWYICYRGREGEQATPSAKSPPIREAIREKKHIFFGQYPYQSKPPPHPRPLPEASTPSPSPQTENAQAFGL